MLYVFPIGVVVGAPFLPLAILIYWVSNNLWTLGQQWVVYRRIDAEETEKRENTVATQKSLAPKPGQKPIRPEQRIADTPEKRPGAKPVTRKPVPPKSPPKPPQPNASSKNGSSAASNGSGGDPSTNGSGKAAADARTGQRKARKRR